MKRLLAPRLLLGWFSVAGPHDGDLAAEQVRGVNVSPGFFDMLGVHAALGRTFRPDEEEPGRDRVAVLTGGFWRRRFGGDGSRRSAVGLLAASLERNEGRSDDRASY